jgi:putative flippase GtrA
MINNLERFLIDYLNFKQLKVVRFMLVGSLNTLLGFLLFPIIYFSLSAYQKNYVQMLVISQLICMLVSFFSNKIYVFRSKNKISIELIKFILFHGFYFFMSVKLCPIIVMYFHIHPIAIQTLLNVLIVVTSYFWYDKFNFSPNKQRKI